MFSLDDVTACPCIREMLAPHGQVSKNVNVLMMSRLKPVLLPLERRLDGGTTKR
jgi:hypothetical protein